MRKKVNYIISFVMLLILSFIFTSCELPYFDFSNTFKNRGVNLDNFLLIDNKMSLNKIKYGLKVNPQETTYGDLITFSFFDNDIDIDLVLDAQNNLCSKSYTASNESLTKSTYGEYNKLRQGMSLQEACDTLGSEGTLTKQVYIDSNYDEKIGTTYLWAIDNQFDSSIKTIECSFDSENKIYKANYSGTIYDTQNENVDPEFLSSGYKKLADIPLGSTIDDAESVLGIKAELCCMGNNNHDLSSSFYKFKARDINYNTFDIDILTDDKGKITKKALYFGENFKFDTTANNLSAYEDAIKKGMSYDEVKNIMGGDGLLYLSETKPQLDNDFAQPPLLMQFVRTISDPSIMCNNLTGYEGDYYSYIENYDWYRSNFQVDVKFVDGKVSSF
ncbi:MAG: hypothetical protein FWC47_17375, partial [Oscillospiraceae bacterium]|nr:hypothetical protein [Oscillospiraceae bacterium]